MKGEEGPHIEDLHSNMTCTFELGFFIGLGYLSLKAPMKTVMIGTQIQLESPTQKIDLIGRRISQA